MRITASEAETQRAIMHLLAAYRIFAIRINTASQVVDDGAGHRRFVRSHFGGKGVADIIAFPKITLWPWGPTKTFKVLNLNNEAGEIPVVLWIEVKSETGEQSDEQASFQKQVEDSGHHYIIARSADDLSAWLKEHK